MKVVSPVVHQALAENSSHGLSGSTETAFCEHWQHVPRQSFEFSDRAWRAHRVWVENSRAPPSDAMKEILDPIARALNFSLASRPRSRTPFPAGKGNTLEEPLQGGNTCAPCSTDLKVFELDPLQSAITPAIDASDVGLSATPNARQDARNIPKCDKLLVSQIDGGVMDLSRTLRRMLRRLTNGRTRFFPIKRYR